VQYFGPLERRLARDKARYKSVCLLTVSRSVKFWCRLADAEREAVLLSDEARLAGALIRRYRKIGKVARPVANSSMPVEVRLSVMLYQLVGVDEHEQFITLKLWIHMVRYDAIPTTYADSDVISFNIDPGWFRRHLVGKTLRNVCYSDVTLSIS